MLNMNAYFCIRWICSTLKPKKQSQAVPEAFARSGFGFAVFMFSQRHMLPTPAIMMCLICLASDLFFSSPIKTCSWKYQLVLSCLQRPCAEIWFSPGRALWQKYHMGSNSEQAPALGQTKWRCCLSWPRQAKENAIGTKPKVSNMSFNN